MLASADFNITLHIDPADFNQHPMFEPFLCDFRTAQQRNLPLAATLNPVDPQSILDHIHRTTPSHFLPSGNFAKGGQECPVSMGMCTNTDRPYWHIQCTHSQKPCRCIRVHCPRLPTEHVDPLHLIRHLLAQGFEYVPSQTQNAM